MAQPGTLPSHGGLEFGKIAMPFVHYHCPCPCIYKAGSAGSTGSAESSVESQKDKSDRLDLPTPPNVQSSCIQFSTFSISKLYFCEDCHEIRCPRCVLEEIVCYYCPNCLFEVPTASVKSERNRCARNCFQCPICQHTLTVVATSEPTPPEAGALTLPSTTAAITSASSVASATGAPYYLQCGVCRWDSKEIDMTFEKPTGLAMQLQKTEDERADVKEFEHLREHFEKHLRTSAPSTSLPAQLYSLPGLTFSSRYHGGSLAHSQSKSDDVGPYEPVVKSKDEPDATIDFSSLKDVNEISTMSQRLNQLSDQPYSVNALQPQRIHLRTKRVKRCRSCRHILIKPEQKAQATRYTIKWVALHYIPKITIAKLPVLAANQTTQVMLKFSNPTSEEVFVSLRASDGMEDIGKVNVLADSFTLSPYNEVWEYDDEELGAERLSKSRSHSHASMAQKTVGIHERRGNATTIILEVTPCKEAEEFVVPLLVTMINTSGDDTDLIKSVNSNASSSNITKETKDHSAATDATSDDVQEAADSSTTPRSTTKAVVFWTVIGLGPVCKNANRPMGTVVVKSTVSARV